MMSSLSHCGAGGKDRDCEDEDLDANGKITMDDGMDSHDEMIMTDEIGRESVETDHISDETVNLVLEQDA